MIYFFARLSPNTQKIDDKCIPYQQKQDPIQIVISSFLVLQLILLTQCRLQSFEVGFLHFVQEMIHTLHQILKFILQMLNFLSCAFFVLCDLELSLICTKVFNLYLITKHRIIHLKII